MQGSLSLSDAPAVTGRAGLLSRATPSWQPWSCKSPTGPLRGRPRLGSPSQIQQKKMCPSLSRLKIGHLRVFFCSGNISWECSQANSPHWRPRINMSRAKMPRCQVRRKVKRSAGDCAACNGSFWRLDQMVVRNTKTRSCSACAGLIRIMRPKPV